MTCTGRTRSYSSTHADALDRSHTINKRNFIYSARSCPSNDEAQSHLAPSHVHQLHLPCSSDCHMQPYVYDRCRLVAFLYLVNHSYNLSLPSFIAFLYHVLIPFIQSFITIFHCLLKPCYTIHTIFHYHLMLPSYTMLYHSYNLSLPSYVAFLYHVIPFIQPFITILRCLLKPCYTIHTTFHYHLTLPSCTMFLYHLIPCLLISVVHIRRQSETAPLILVLK